MQSNEPSSPADDVREALANYIPLGFDKDRDGVSNVFEAAGRILEHFEVRPRGELLEQQAGAAVENARAILSDPDGVSHRDAIKAIRRLLAVW